MHSLEISEACTGCKECVDVCFVNAIVWDDAKELPLLAYPADCQICAVCERACPAGAIEIIPDWESRYCPKYLSTERKQNHDEQMP